MGRFSRRGVLQFDIAHSTFNKIPDAKDLSKVIISAIAEDEQGNLWMSTKKNGIIKYNPSTKLWRNYDENDGLQGNEFNRSFAKSNTGELYFGGKNGFNVFHPDSIKDNSQAPVVAINGFKVFDKPRSFGKDITLAYTDNFFSFDFVALSYALPEKNQYAYRLAGFDKEWIQAGTRRYASYTNLDPGEYVFKVKASNHDGVWNEEGASVKVIILPPFWQTWWAYGGYGLTGILLLFVFRYYILSRERLKNNLRLKSIESEKLQELDEIKSRFYANISHELRTPLTLIKSPLEKLLYEEVAEKKKKGYYQLMHHHTERLLELIGQLLDLSKLETGQIKVELTTCDSVKLLKAYVLSFLSLAEGKQIKLSFHSTQNELLARLDRDKLKKIMYNLLSNAFKFTADKGEISVTVKDLKELSQEWIQIEVKDTGIGIPADQVDRIFDRFYQVDNSNTREYEGTGIGLALTRELVELQGGKIRVASQEGVGTSFIIELPLIAVHKADETRSEELNHSYLPFPLQKRDVGNLGDHLPIDEEQNPQRPLLLLVEDNEDVRAYIRSNFDDRYRIVEAENGAKGLQLAQELVPDIIISDWMMPKMDGASLCERIKTDERTSHIPFILLTARASIESKLTGLETGADDYITKPFHTGELVMRVKNALEAHKKLRERFSREFTAQAPVTTAITPAEEVPSSQVNSMDHRFLEKVIAIIDANLSDPDFSSELLEKELAMSRTQFYRKIKALTNQAPGEFIRNYRIKKAADLLSQHEYTVSEVAYKVGFSNLSYFTKCFRQMYGKVPSEFMGA